MKLQSLNHTFFFIYLSFIGRHRSFHYLPILIDCVLMKENYFSIVIYS